LLFSYQYFQNEKNQSKWKSSVRYNLSRHKFFIKTNKKDSGGHYWSINPFYLEIYKNTNYESIKEFSKTSSHAKTFRSSVKAKTNNSARVNEPKAVSKRHANPNQLKDESLIGYSSSISNDSAYASSFDIENSFNNEKAPYGAIFSKNMI
jgi:hypothetical protein